MLSRTYEDSMLYERITGYRKRIDLLHNRKLYETRQDVQYMNRVNRNELLGLKRLLQINEEILGNIMCIRTIRVGKKIKIELSD